MHSLAALSCLVPALVGCLAPAPTEFTKPKKSTPSLDLANAVPPPTQLLVASNEKAQSFRVRFQSEDDGDVVCGALYLDFGLEGARNIIGVNRIPPSTFEDTSREIELTWAVDATPGCHQLTMLVTHESNFDSNKQFPKALAQDTAMAVWWVHVDPEDSDGGQYDMPECPKPIGQVPEAGPTI